MLKDILLGITILGAPLAIFACGIAFLVTQSIAPVALAGAIMLLTCKIYEAVS